MAQPANRSQDDVTRIAEPVAGDHGLYLEEVRVTRAGNRSVVRITLDLPEDRVGSLDSDTLGEASRAISAALDDADAVAGAYTLEISTPGVSRPLTTARHFRRARTRLVTLALADGGTASGRLTDVRGTGATGDDDAVVLVLDDAREIPLGSVARGSVEVELKRADDAAFDDDDAADAAEEPVAGRRAGDADRAGVRESSGADDDSVTRLPREGAAGRDEEG
ncbi:ribosome maturation factor RimP [Myceligenerans crystallogenes]|uniref:Ribosome maturation factor RimP n=1 Tax=Myceligenerans crystallogenes TaxID=316335 RepID=A0ABN2NK50_9MICO